MSMNEYIFYLIKQNVEENTWGRKKIYNVKDGYIYLLFNILTHSVWSRRITLRQNWTGEKPQCVTVLFLQRKAWSWIMMRGPGNKIRAYCKMINNLNDQNFRAERQC